MKKNQENGLLGRNPFADAFAVFDEKAFFEQLHHRVKNKSYYEKYKGFKNTLLVLSYLFNIASALTASYAIYWLTHRITGIPIVSYAVAFLFLFFLEKIKRKSSSEFFQVIFFRKQFALGWLVLSLFCLLLSLASSGFGVKKGTETLAPTPELLAADSTLQFYYAEIERLEQKSSDLRSNKDKTGTTFYKLSDGITANEKSIAAYRTEAKRLEKKLEGNNEQLTNDYMIEIEVTKWTLIYINLFMELLFECCIAYVWYFYYRSYVERHPSLQSSSESKLRVDTTQIEELQATIKTLLMENESLRTDSIPPPSSNGIEIQNRNPIGFKRGQTSTHEYTLPKSIIHDRHTIAHKYTRGGKEITVHYNAAMVKSRITEYIKKVKEAQDKAMSEATIKNRKKWLAYWKGREEELKNKLQPIL